MRKTKIVCTIGPATEGKEQLRALADAGMDVARLNFSHGSYEWHGERIRLLREIEQERGCPIAIHQDLCDPKLRIGQVPDDGIELPRGSESLLSTEPFVPGPVPRIPIPLPGLLEALQRGGLVFMDDAQIEMDVIATGDAGIRCSTAGFCARVKASPRRGRRSRSTR